MNRFLFVIIMLLFQGCTSFIVDYQAPTEGPTANLTIRSEFDGANEQILFHGDNPCDFAGTKFVGLLNALAIGQERFEELAIVVPANREINISTPQQALTDYQANKIELSYCQPILSFVPKPGEEYVAIFRPCSATLYRADKDTGQLTVDKNGRLNDRCEPTVRNMGTPGKSFFLEEK